ncbi:putative Polycomb complex protein BMI-1 [Hypsibius exemplaris]|uniref:Polycomb complex protein BMI-1 n=1 Tax=Hypsibius exemplaris TaxID=2072580 RepID=A0A1W0WMP4_HYPEX|nr:putative Polycomb complex protein BMI-1 [Hypsibius exemplaris]
MVPLVKDQRVAFCLDFDETKLLCSQRAEEESSDNVPARAQEEEEGGGLIMSQWDQLRTVALSEINARFSCPLCRGYIIDCVTAEECGHAYCRSCIARHIANGTVTCPSCARFINKDEPGEPFQKLKADPVLQRLIFKLVPNLVSKETERRATYLGSEKAARQEVKQSVGDGALFFNDRSCVCIELKPRLISPPATPIAREEKQESCYLRMELSSPLCILVDYVKLRTGTNAKVSLSSSPKAPVLEHDLRLVDLAYLIAWDMKRPLPVYYELIDSHNQPAGRLQPLTPMLRTKESNPRSSDKPSDNRPQTSSSILVRTHQGSSSRPDYHPTKHHHRHQSQLAAPHSPYSSHMQISQPSLQPTPKLKLKLNKNNGGTWQATSAFICPPRDEATDSREYGSITTEPDQRGSVGRPRKLDREPDQRGSVEDQRGSVGRPRKLDREPDQRGSVEDQGRSVGRPRKLDSLFEQGKEGRSYAVKRPFEETHDPVVAPKVAKVLPFPVYTGGDEEEIPYLPRKDAGETAFRFRADSDSEILKSTGLVPFSPTSSGNNIMSIRRILQG